MSVTLSTHASVHLHVSTHPSVRLSIHSSVHLSIHPYIFYVYSYLLSAMCVSLYLSICVDSSLIWAFTHSPCLSLSRIFLSWDAFCDFLSLPFLQDVRFMSLWPSGCDLLYCPLYVLRCTCMCEASPYVTTFYRLSSKSCLNRSSLLSDATSFSTSLCLNKATIA